jgi:poly-beta-hydroxyalkanoate depolymerase
MALTELLPLMDTFINDWDDFDSVVALDGHYD